MVQMSLRILENLPKELPPRSNVILQKEFIFSDKPLLVSAKLDSGVYKQGEKIKLVLSIQRQDNFPHEVRKIKAAAIQQVNIEGLISALKASQPEISLLINQKN